MLEVTQIDPVPACLVTAFRQRAGGDATSQPNLVTRLPFDQELAWAEERQHPRPPNLSADPHLARPVDVGARPIRRRSPRSAVGIETSHPVRQVTGTQARHDIGVDVVALILAKLEAAVQTFDIGAKRDHPTAETV